MGGSVPLPLLIVIVTLSWILLTPVTVQLQTSQTQVLQQLRKHLEYPEALQPWEGYKDLCYLPPTPQVSIVCEANTISELRIFGDKPANISKFDGFPIHNLTLSDAFSVDSFVTTLSRLGTLRVLSLVSLGIWGPLSDKIHRLQSLESLDLCSNFLYGSIPPKISTMTKLQILNLNSNFFNGTVPDWFDSLSNLTLLDLKSNRLNGPFPLSISKLTKLTDLALSHNEISGKLPDLSSLTSLHVLDLRENQLDSELPLMPKGLVNVFLMKNSFFGEIPKEFSSLVLLQHLDMSFNLLRGTPPAKLFSLPNISYLNLASNMLTGSLDDHLTCSGALGFVDISNNKFTGGLPSCLRSASGNRVVKYGQNCLSVDLKNQHQASYCVKEAETSRSGGKNIGVLVAVIAGIVIFVAVLAIGFLCIVRRYCPRGVSVQHLLPKAAEENSATQFSSEVLASARFTSDATKLGRQGGPVYRVFNVNEIKDATNNFDKSMFIGKGSIGEIYKGRLENGTYVAIRCLALFKRYSIRNLKLRLDVLSKLRHRNLVCLLGHCIDGCEKDDLNVNQVFLVYEYVSNGDLHSHLSETSPEKVLKWSERLTVFIDIAKAVHFLHTGMLPGFFNNQLKIKNILLDENRIAKLSDYGLSIITKEIGKHEAKGDQKVSWRTTKFEDDVFSFGFMLLEMLAGSNAAKRGESFLLNEMASFSSPDSRKLIVDPIILSTCSQESLSIVISITNKCISPDSSSQPSFEDVLWNLQYAAQIQAASDSDQKSDTFSQP